MKKEDIITCLTDPVQSKIFLSILQKQELTTKELLKINPSIPQATLYRNLKKLIEKNLLTVAKENKVRAMTEKVYSVNPNFSQNYLNDTMADNSQVYFSLFSLFIAEQLRIFKDYTEQEGIDLKHDGSAFSTAPFFATYTELEEISNQITQILAPYLEQTSTAQSLRSLALILSPPQNELKQNKNQGEKND